MSRLIIKLSAAAISLLFACAGVNAQNNDDLGQRTAFLTGGDAANINWPEALPGAVDASYKTFFASQQGWDLDRRLLDYHRELTVMYFGTQEALLGQGLNDVRNGYNMLCTRVIASGSTPIVALPLPVTERYSLLGGKLGAIAEMVKDYCGEKGIAWFDASAGLVSDGWLKEEYSSDGMMLNEKGLELFKANILAAVKEYFGPDYDSAGINLVRSSIDSIQDRAPKKTRVAFLGDSITAGGGEWGRFFGRKDMKNCGVGGFMTGQILWLMDETVIEAKPKMCIYMAGINDLANKIPYDVIFENEVRIVRRLLDAGIVPVVESTLYTLHNTAQNDEVDIINARIRDWCKENGVTYLDVNTILSEDHHLREDYSVDGVHVNEQAYKAWCAYLSEQLGI